MAHLVVAWHDPNTVTTLCAELKAPGQPGEAGLPLCQHCEKVLAELNATVQ